MMYTVEVSVRDIITYAFVPGDYTDSKHETFTRCWLNVGPASATLTQHSATIELFVCSDTWCYQRVRERFNTYVYDNIQ